MGRVDIVVAFLALLVCLVSADQISDLQAKGFKIDSESPYHVTLTATVLNSETNTIQTETVVVNKEVSSKELLANKVLQRRLSGGKSAEENNLLDVVPVFMGTASQGSVATFSAPCFQQYTATAKITPSGAMIQLVANKASSWTCSDWFLLATRYSLAVKSAFLHGTHNVHMTFKNSEEYEDALNNGIRIFNFKNGALGTIMDAWNGIHLFIGADLTADNVKFLEATMDMKFTERANKPYFPAESEVESGDYLAVTRLDGLDPMIMYGTGSYVGHTAMVLEVDGVLYVCESTDKNPFGKGYWPPPYGIIRTPYQQWLKQAQAANYIVILAKLHPTYRAKFDSVAAANAFKKLEGLPYGYHNFVYGWIDTPNNNLPYPLTPQTLDIALSFVDKLIPTQITRIFVDGLNKRFDTYYNVTTNCTSMDCAFSTLQSLNTTLFEAMSLVELDEWTYSDGKSMVCDVFVLSMYKASGMLGDLANNIQATEFTPKDLYQMKIFDDQYVAPAACQVPGYPYCQILGDFTWALPGFNSIEPYAHMNEKCGAMPPTYVRTPANC